MQLTPATRLGPYEIVALLGKGAMGEVYRARDTRLKRDIAIKVLPEDVASSPARFARFEREATTVAGLNHPNIMVTRDGRVKVLDFGLAKVTQEESDLETTQGETRTAALSMAGEVMGTAPYMAPEQIRGEAVDARADLFSFGVLVFELASGKRPFAGPTLADLSRHTAPCMYFSRTVLSRPKSSRCWPPVRCGSADTTSASKSARAPLLDT